MLSRSQSIGLFREEGLGESMQPSYMYVCTSFNFLS